MARAVTESQPLYDNSDPDTEPETPRPPKKKRISEAYNPDADASLVSDSGVRAHKSIVDVNDDIAEKRRRRKSTKIAAPDNAQAGPSSDGNDDRVDTSRTTKQKQPLASVLGPQEKEKVDILASNFEEWMKLTTDNKITAANTWDFALIDYFHEMSLLRNTDDNSINFQRASCTLDGCVKIWTSRVDSVSTETTKLASNLASGDNLDDDDDADSDDPDGQQAKEKKKKASRRGHTLVNDPIQLKNKKPDLEFSVDPLFRKTCADFDEGGAQGLLMNHLSLGVGSDGSLRVVFDAGDSVAKTEEEEENIDEPEDFIDLTHLRADFLPDLGALENKLISHELSDFAFAPNSFANDEASFFQENTTVAGLEDNDDDDDDNGADAFDALADGPQVPVEDFFAGDNAINDDFGGGMMMDGDDFGEGESTGSVGPSVDVEGGNGYVAFDPRQVLDQRDLMLAMNNDDGGGMMDYFDRNLVQNWAGPEHWRLRRPTRKADADAKAAKPRREKKEPNKIDFLTPLDPNTPWKSIADELFAPPKNAAMIHLTGTSTTAKKRRGKDDKKRDSHCLPDDMHFSSRQLVTLFLKPKFSLKMRGQRGSAPENDDGEVDANYWAQAAAQQANRSQGDFDDGANGDPIPFNTQFFNDEYDDGPGFDDAYDGGDGAPIDPGEQDLLAGTQGQTRRVKPEAVKFAKRAKRVDVRKLKENIWKGLDIVTQKQADEEDMDVDEESSKPTEARPFTSVISNLQRSYPPDKMQEISTSFCFICLLHLANEEGLKLENGAALVNSDDSAVDTNIGNIWDLKVYRDPEAAQVA